MSERTKQLTLFGIIAALAAAALWKLTRKSAVVYGDDFGGAPPAGDVQYFPRLGGREPLPAFQQTSAPMQYPSSPWTPPPPALPDLQLPAVLGPVEKADNGDKGSDCIKVCQTCENASPFVGADLFRNAARAASNVQSFVERTYNPEPAPAPTQNWNSLDLTPYFDTGAALSNWGRA